MSVHVFVQKISSKNLFLLVLASMFESIRTLPSALATNGLISFTLTTTAFPGTIIGILANTAQPKAPNVDAITSATVAFVGNRRNSAG